MPQNFANKTLRGRPFNPGDDLRGANFQGASLRGVNFKNLDLSRANFSGADIRGANFSNATLVKANFSKAIAGLQKRWMIAHLISIILLLTILNFSAILLSVFFTAALLTPSGIERYTIFPGLASILVLVITCVAIVSQGLTEKAAGTILVAGAGVGAGAIVFVGAGAVAGAGAGAGAVAGAVVVAGAGIIVVESAIVVAVVVAGIVAVAGAVAVESAIVVAVVVANAILLLSFYVAWRTAKGDEKFALARNLGVAIGSIGGTSFCGADLTAANFTGAHLKSANFNNHNEQPTTLTHTCWADAKHLNRARVDSSILVSSAVRDLLVTRRGHNQNYSKANVSGANLIGVDLTQANLTRADLSNALLHKTDLKDANLREANVLGADLTGAYLAGACIEAWNLDATTILKNVDCQHIFLLEQPNRYGTRERRPSSGNFAPGEFTKLFQEVLSTIDLIFQNGIDWKAFVTAFKTLQVQNQETELTIQSIENKGDGVVVVRVDAPPDANKEKLHSEFNQNYDDALKALEAKYQAELQAKENEIALHREKYSDLKEISMLMAQQPINVKATSKSTAMNDSPDSSRKIEIGKIGRDFNPRDSVLNLGDISGTVTNTLQQLQTANHPNAPQLADLLQQLQTAINDEPTLLPEDKAEALTEVNVLAEAGKNPQKETQQKKANTALEILKSTIAALTPTAALVKACSELLPAIAKLLGL
jgi:uncharacterized protein YjbI with pentapeptide repeats